MTIDLQIGDNREILLKYPDKHFDCVMTSPPYWGLRDYDNPSLIFDGDPDYEHDWNENVRKVNLKGNNEYEQDNMKGTIESSQLESEFCSKCNAWKGQLGLEPTPELFIKHLADTFDIVKNKLKNEGNCFVNIGDTYSANRGYQVDGTKQVKGSQPTIGMTSDKCGVPVKCLCMIPQRFAWEMIQHGWILRNSIVWYKQNHMPESVTDRLTKSYEIIYHFVKQEKYYYDLNAIRETHKWINPDGSRIGSNTIGAISKIEQYDYKGKLDGRRDNESCNNPRARTQRKNDNTGYGTDGGGIQNHSGNSLNHPLGKNPGDCLELGIDDLSETELKIEIIELIQEWQSLHPEDWSQPEDFWTVNTQSYSKAHFATFPYALIKKPILAGCPKDGWVLDPFAGSGTVGEFCNDNYRNAVLIELNPEYKPLIVDRTNLKQIALSKIFSYVK